MLDTDTKRRIDTCRDILVGKVPDPKSQVEQITIALIYKFMDDMDAEAEELGGARHFFKGENAKYGWSKLMAPGMGGFDMLGLYSEAIQKMNENSAIPELFRDIFKNAYLPYRDPETLRSFLKEIDGFKYDHSERLGDAFEYLLSVLGSQGDAGQFRTPRHIIDFMVEVIDPQKNEVILDPACGTAGFLISSYKHILKRNSKDYQAKADREAYDEKGVPLESLTLESPLRYKGDLLTPDERKRMAKSIKGYDISPDMVRLSLVNMYLHGFAEPDIEEYDTLTSEERWNEHADVILANPPFMSPKGGIKPHKKFSIQASRSEVLFVDYIAEHLTPTGRAAVIVPEGIIFQSGGAYKQLREMLVKQSLVAVVSLPAGVFNPYSGVKTSILIMDRRLAKKTDSILFVKIENDGFNLGAQRRPIDKNDLPSAVRNITAWMDSVRNDKAIDLERYPNLNLIEKKQISGNGDYNLSGERYKDNSPTSADFSMANLEEVVEILDSRRKPITKSDRKPGDFPYYGATGVLDYVEDYIFDEELILVGEDGAKWGAGEKTAYAISGKTWVNNHAHVLRPKRDQLLDVYLIEILNQMDLSPFITGVTVPKLNQEKLRSIQIPLPPLDVQKEIVAEIESYQKIINGARQIVESYQPRIPLKPDWPMVEFEKAPLEIIDGDRGSNYPKKADFTSEGFCLFLNTSNVRPDGFLFEVVSFISKEKDAALRKGKLKREDVILTTRGTIGNTAYYDKSVPYDNVRINSGMLIFRPDSSSLDGRYLFNYFQSDNFKQQVSNVVSGAAQPQLPIRSINQILIPIPDIDTQRTIVAEIENERKLVDGNKELIPIFEAKIKATINRVWGETE